MARFLFSKTAQSIMLIYFLSVLPMYIIDDYDTINLSNKRGAKRMKLMNSVASNVLVEDKKYMDQFTKQQQDVIKDYYKKGYDVSIILNNQYTHGQMD